jgi:peroxiredoxin
MNSLLEAIEHYKQNAGKRIPDEVRAIMAKATEELKASDKGKGLKVGEQAPDFSLPDATGKEVQLSSLVKKGPVVLTFYRGAWCPYCNLELQAYQQVLDELHQAGAELVAISLQSPDKSLTTKEKNELSFYVLSDVGGEVAQKYNLLFTLPDYLIDVYKTFQLNVDQYNGDQSWNLPVPATFIIDRDQTIRYAYVDEDYTKRAEPKEVLEKVKQL